MRGAPLAAIMVDTTLKLAGLQRRMDDVHIGDRFLGKGSVLGKTSGMELIKSALGKLKLSRVSSSR